MVTKLQTKQSGNADLDAVFDPYVTGTSPPATGFNVGGTSTDINTRYAPIVYGSAAAATGLNTQQSGNADLNTLFAAFGTARYTLPIDGQTYNAQGFSPVGTVVAHVDFQIGVSGGWTLITSGSGSSPVIEASGSVPTGMVSVSITDTWLNAIGDTGPGTTVNTCPTITTIPPTGTVGCSVGLSAVTTGQTTHRVVVTLYNSGGTAIYVSTYEAVCVTSH